MAPPICTISAARQKFFELFEAVTAHRERKVVITSRGAVSRAVLVGEDYLSALEGAAMKLRNIESRNARPASDFKLVGSGRIARGTDSLTDIRAEQRVLRDKKLDSFGE
jgi:PHD/YefM family antitoxin component YafN of YafNO toxin-antitoxin module